MEKESTILMLLVVFNLRVCLAASLNRSETDKMSLLAVKEHISSNILAKNWSQDTPFCTWIGISCGRKHLRVTALDLSSMALRGSIAPEIGNLSFLRLLNISNNNINGQIPGEIGKLRRLRVLDMALNQLSYRIPQSLGLLRKLKRLYLSENYLSGDIPGNLSTCVELNVLDLSYNKITGNIPIGFGNLLQLQEILLRSNQLTGTIPPSIGNLSNLVMFDIGENNLYGTVPSEIGQLSSLAWLNLQENKINGEVPQSIFNLSSLQLLSLAYNNLSGSLPFSIDEGLPNIEQIFLGNAEARFNLLANQFYGQIPSSISNLSRLTILDLSSNSFSGDIPITIGSLRKLQVLNLAFNRLTNNLSMPEKDFISPLATCKYLKSVNISFNLITGVLPISLGLHNLSTSLETFEALSCRILSSIPNEIGNLSNLIWLNLGYNLFTGAIPMTVGHLRNLQKLELNGNRFQGSISHALCNLNNVYLVNLEINSFFGQLPSCLGNLSSLKEIHLSHNAFTSYIPSSLWNNERIKRLYFSNNFLNGSLPQDIGNMKSLTDLDLSGNQLSGEIPSNISQLHNLISVSLSNNKLDGPISESFADLKGLQNLDLSHNNLSGRIPKSLEALPHLHYLDVSFNNLTGEIPDGGSFVNFTAEFFTGNKGLCGAPRFKVEECKMPRSSSKNRLLKYVLPYIAFAVVVALILLSLSRRKASSSEMSLIFTPRISYFEIVRATGNFDVRNMIGRGGFGTVYKGILSYYNFELVAIKVFDLEVHDALKSFDAECQVLRNVRHRNIVMVLTCCSNHEFKALVMECIPNGNLEKWLYSPNYSLTIVERFGIMTDVAYAIEYLHEGCEFPVIHCDLKPSNILLDEDMVAHVCDFGIAKLLTQEQRMYQTRTLGTTGYVAPEYGSDGLISTSVDVYSYGILLMELFTGKRPTDEMFSGELTMRRWVSESFPDMVTQIVDDEFPNMDDEITRRRYESCLTSIIEVALDCTENLPEERPTMGDVSSWISQIGETARRLH